MAIEHVTVEGKETDAVPWAIRTRARLSAKSSTVSNPTLASQVLLYLSDIFGPQLLNAHLLVDGFAKNAYQALDIPILVRPTWTSRPFLDKVTAALKDQGVTTVAVGAFGSITSVSITNHPSLLKSPDDWEAPTHSLTLTLSASRAPLLLDTHSNSNEFHERTNTYLIATRMTDTKEPATLILLHDLSCQSVEVYTAWISEKIEIVNTQVHQANNFDQPSAKLYLSF
ncbi:hypothetical protein EV368DRAFT_66820 [Lentinula lateritia]|nr:hypothetical protein EV368DRAFT_66820 [Lentinula lateritia]